MNLQLTKRSLIFATVLLTWCDLVFAAPPNDPRGPGPKGPSSADERRPPDQQPPSGQEGDKRDRYRSLREDMMRQSGPQRSGGGPVGQPPMEQGLRRLSPEERQQLRRDVRDAGKDVYGR